MLSKRVSHCYNSVNTATERGIYFSAVWCHIQLSSKRKSNLTCLPSMYCIKSNKRHAVKKAVYCDWTIDHVKTCILSIPWSILIIALWLLFRFVWVHVFTLFKLFCALTSKHEKRKYFGHRCNFIRVICIILFKGRMIYLFIYHFKDDEMQILPVWNSELWLLSRTRVMKEQDSPEFPCKWRDNKVRICHALVYHCQLSSTNRDKHEVTHTLCITVLSAYSYLVSKTASCALSNWFSHYA